MIVRPSLMRRVGPVTSGDGYLATQQKLQSLHQLWREEKGNAALPRREVFGFAKLKHWLGHIALVEVARDPVQFRYRLFGSYLAELNEADLTGKWLDQAYDDMVLEVLDPFYGCIRTGRPVAAMHKYDSITGERGWLQQLLLPCCSPSDERSVDLIVAAVYLDNERRLPSSATSQRIECNC